MTQEQTFTELFNALPDKTVNTSDLLSEIWANVRAAGPSFLLAGVTVDVAKAHLFPPQEDDPDFGYLVKEIFECSHDLKDTAITKSMLSKNFEALGIVSDSDKKISSDEDCTIAAAITNAWNDCEDLSDQVDVIYHNVAKLECL